MSPVTELVRVPRAWGTGGETMAAAAFLGLPYATAAVIEATSLDEQRRLTGAALPERPFVLGGGCCAHVGAIEELASRVDTLTVVWIDAHGDLNTPETSPSGNEWGMPLRMAIDAGAVEPANVALVGARNLDPPEEEYIAAVGVRVGDGAVERALAGADAVYIAFDADAVEPGDLAVFMPEPDGIRLDAAEALLRGVAARADVLGLGFSGLVREPANEPKLARLAASAGL